MVIGDGDQHQSSLQAHRGLLDPEGPAGPSGAAGPEGPTGPSADGDDD